MSFEEWFKQNTNDSVNENIMFSKQFVEDAYNFAKQEGKTELDFMERACDGAAEMYDNLKAARELIKNIIRVTWGEGWNYSLDWKVKAEQFLKETER